MASLILRKPCYGVAELCQRWGVSELDIAHFALVGELTLSATVTNLPVEEGSIEEMDHGQWVDIPENYRRVSGTLDLFAENAWTALTQGWVDVHAFKAPKGHYVCVRPLTDEDGYHRITKDRLVVRHDELLRFEAVQAEPAPAVAEVVRTSVRGALPQYDWDAFWCEAAASLHMDGIPNTQAEMIRRMEAWFAARGQFPEKTTIRRKVSLLWRRIHQEAA